MNFVDGLSERSRVAAAAIIWIALIFSLAATQQARADSSPFDNSTFSSCLFWWSDIGDDGYTDSHQDGYVAALNILMDRYPAVTFATRRVTNVAFAADKVAVYKSLASIYHCHLVYFAYSDLYANASWLVGEALSHPERLYLVGDVRVYDPTWPRNLVTAEPICDREWYLAGALAGAMFPTNLSLTMTVSYEETGTGYAAHALASGIRRGQQGQSAFSQPRVVPMNSWIAETNEGIVAALAVEKNGAQVLTHFTDPYIVSSVAHDRDQYSIGWDHDYSTFYLSSLLTSILRVYDSMVLEIMEDWLFNVSTPRIVVGCHMTAFSAAVPDSIVALIANINATLNMSQDVWSDEFYYNASGDAVLAGPLSLFDVASIDFIPNSSVLNPVFLGGSVCADNTYGVYNATPDYVSWCVACPDNTFSTGGAACAACTVNEPLCAISKIDRSSKAKVITVIAISVGIGVPLLSVALLVIVYLFRRARRLKLEIRKRNDQESAESSSRSGDRAAQDALRADFIRDAIQRGEYYLGTGLPNLAVGATVFKCFQNDGGTLTMYEFHRKTAEEARVLDDVLFRVTDHPNIVRVYCVVWREETSSAQIFCESSSGGSVVEMLAETKGRLPEQTARILAVQILRAMGHLHDQRCCHRIIGAPFVVLSSSGTPRLLCGPHTTSVDMDSDASVTVVGNIMSQCPPEVLTGAFEGSDAFQNSQRIDVWLYGVFVAQILNGGASPWPIDPKQPGALARLILTQQSGQPVVSAPVSGTAKHFVSRCTEPKPSNRPSAAELQLHPWVCFTKVLLGGESTTGAGSTNKYFNGPVAVPKAPSGVIVGKLIGMGSFGSVHLVTLADGSQVAMKSIMVDLADTSATNRVRLTQREYNALTKIDHPNIVRYISFELDVPEGHALPPPKVIVGGGGGGKIKPPTAHHGGGGAFAGDAYDAKSPHDEEGDSSSSGPSIGGGTSCSGGGMNAICQMRVFMEYVPSGNLKQFFASNPQQLTAIEQPSSLEARSSPFSSTTNHHRRSPFSSAKNHHSPFFTVVPTSVTPPPPSHPFPTSPTASLSPQPSVLVPIVRAMLRAIEATHSHGIIHRDIKPSNFLYCGPPHYVKLADFGSAAMIEGDATKSVSMQGTLLYMAPEILREEVPSVAADIWSLGATVMELATRQPPWSHVFGLGSPVMAVVAYIASNEPLQFPQYMDPLLLNFLEKCLIRDPTLRASASELLLHEWVA
ncbi:protein tyrosine kinase, putative [Bodo saltans]|uniref:Protein tyrosine kinase, putative n=1 Tax=Bodo saltans TaxID=75058 RepID=A0A0S4JL49_BODSA|nr:protein tyrosine kinase, putative [Bodo saltans]|eukprot:CUG89945.1 protein tyrosine kinase, putative [Bodo saltans]